MSRARARERERKGIREDRRFAFALTATNSLCRLVGRIVRGWNVVRAYGSFSHLARSNPLGRFHLPCPKLYRFFFSFFSSFQPIPSLFFSFSERSEGASGSLTCRLPKPFLPVAYFYPNGVDELIFTDLLYVRCSVLRSWFPSLPRSSRVRTFSIPGHLSTACQRILRVFPFRSRQR